MSQLVVKVKNSRLKSLSGNMSAWQLLKIILILRHIPNICSLQNPGKRTHRKERLLNLNYPGTSGPNATLNRTTPCAQRSVMISRRSVPQYPRALESLKSLTMIFFDPSWLTWVTYEPFPSVNENAPKVSNP